ncbi:Hypothetical protein FKW44_022519 [Caligus rogercresseyi]|uniref:Uncharacterized protein n=1 Tax=Caligus rogercresseyi TaxID=217165 RepID=A0A7T8JU19_CALRO|nr:Hypothetical protein FKW44_022519 [Caligus rogercresseyi]
MLLSPTSPPPVYKPAPNPTSPPLSYKSSPRPYTQLQFTIDNFEDIRSSVLNTHPYLYHYFE